MNSELWQAKVEVIAAFANGPGMTISDAKERDKRIVSLLTLLEMEYESVQPKGQNERRTDTGEMTSNNFTDWPALIADLKEHPGISKTLVYSKMSTATATASRQRNTFPEITIQTERRGKEGLVILTYDPPKR